MGRIERESDPEEEGEVFWDFIHISLNVVFCFSVSSFFKFEFAVIKKMNLFMSFLFFLCVCAGAGV